MGPVKRLIPIAFSGGIDTKTDPKHVLPGKLLDLQNGIFQQTGALNRRWGYKALGKSVIGSGSPISACKAIDGGYNSELLLFDGLNAYSYIPANDAWANRGGVVSVIQTNQTIVRNSSQQLSPDHARLNGVDVYAWEDSRGGIRYSIFDSASGAAIITDQPIYPGAPSNLIRPKCIAFPGTNTIGIFHVDNVGNLSCVQISASAPAQNPGPTPLMTTLVPGTYYDVTASSTTGAIYIAHWLVESGGNAFTVSRLATGPMSITWTANAVSVGGTIGLGVAITIDPSTDKTWIFAGQSGGNVTGQITNAAGTSFSLGVPIVTAPGTVQSIAAAVTAGVPTIFVESLGAGGNASLNIISQFTVTAFVISALTTFARGCGLASKPFYYGSALYVNVATQTQQQSTYFTLDSSGRVVAKALATLGGGVIASSDFVLPECQQVSPGIFVYANLVKGIVNTEAGTVLSLLGVNATSLDFIDSNHFLSAEINGSFYTVGGILQSYDGTQYVEHGFHMYPEAIVATPSGSGGLMLSGTYNYAVTYEWVDNNGATQISTPSIVYAVTVTGPTGSVQHTIPTLRLTKKSRVKIVVYRTTAGGTLLYRVTSAAVPVYNDPTVDTISFVDALADTSITSNGLMYTQPLTIGSNPVLPNAAPPACSLIATFANRLFIAGLDDPFGLAYTQAALQGTPMQFASLLTLRSDPDGGPITAIQRMDDKLIIFKKTSIFYITGQGPTATGDQSDFGTPISIPSGGVGCASQNSIVLTPVGILFQSLNGIYLLDRGLNVSYKGAPVEGFNSLTITSATLVPNQWVIFTTSTDKAIVYDYYYDQWATFTNHSATDSDVYLGANNAFVFARPDGTVFEQTPGVFTDAGTAIPFRALTAKINPGQIQGYQRVYHAFLLGTYKGTHTLSVQCLFDYDDTFTAMTLIPSDSTLGIGSTFGTASPFGNETPFGGASSGQRVYQYRLDVLRKCQSIQFDITDQQSAPGNEGFSLSALSLLVGVKQGGFKMPSIKQFGVS
jgi:hypothetical protein